jgi:hypothetical protein
MLIVELLAVMPKLGLEEGLRGLGVSARTLAGIIGKRKR